MSSAAKPEFLTQDAFYSLLPPDPSSFMSSLVASCFESGSTPLNNASWCFPLHSRNHLLDANALVRQLRLRPIRVVLRAIEPVIIDVCQPYETFESAIHAAQMLYIRFATVTLALSRHADRPITLLRTLGSLDQYTGRTISLGARMRANLAILRRIMNEDSAVRPLLEAGQLPREGVFADSWRLILERYGHRADNETDLAAPRYAEQREEWIQAVLSPESPAQFQPFSRSSLRGAITSPVWRAALRYHYAQEHFRHSTMYAFAHLRNELLRLADRHLEGKDSIWSMTVEEVLSLEMASVKPLTV